MTKSPQRRAPSRLCCPDLKPSFTAHRNPWFRVMSRGTYFTLEYPHPQTVILPVVGGNSVAMIRSRRPLLADDILDLPAGGALRGETPRTAAARELREETGIRVSKLSRFVKQLPLAELPCRIPELLNIFRVDISEKEFQARAPHDSEVLSVEKVSFREVRRRILSGGIYAAPAVAILSRLLLGGQAGRRVKGAK